MQAIENDKLPRVFGLPNIGNICWFNALLQSLVSCTSLITAVRQAEVEKSTNLFRALTEFIDSLSFGDAAVADSHGKLFRTFNQELTKRKLHFGNTQQDCEEAFGLFIELLGNSEIESMFTHKKIIRILDRHNTKTLYLEKTSHENRFYINILKYLKLQENNSAECVLPYMLQLQKDLLQDYTPEKTIPGSGEYITATHTATLPEILVVVLQKYTRKIPVFTPQLLRFRLDKSDRYIEYRIVSIIQHSGTTHSGHYTATCLREDESLYFASDTYTQQKESFNLAQANNYIIFYHYAGVVDV